MFERLDRIMDGIERDPLKAALVFIAVAVVVIGICMMAAIPAHAEDATVSWTHPTTNVGGSAIPSTGAGSISSTRIEYGSCSGTAFGTKTGEVSVPAPASSTTITGLAPASTLCFRAYSRNTYGVESVSSAVVSKTFPPPTPNPPVLAVPVIAGMLQTPAYSVTSAGKISTLMGFVDVGAQCTGPALFTYRGKTFHEVPRASVKLWGSTSLRLAAPCG